MNQTYPIKDLSKVKQVVQYYPEDSRNRLLITFLIQVGLRVSDTLSIKLNDFTTINGNTYLKMTESKTGKVSTIKINNTLNQMIQDYIEENDLSDNDYLFSSTKYQGEPLSRYQAHRIISKAGESIDENLSAHSLRKTFGYHYYQSTKDIASLMRLFNHSSQDITLRYIGLEQQAKDDAYDFMSYLGF